MQGFEKKFVALQSIDQLIFYPAQNFIHMGFARDSKG